MHGRDEDSQVIRITTGNMHPAAPAVSGRDVLWPEIGAARREAGLSIEQVAAAARVSPLVVEAIESGAVERLPVGNGGRRETVAVCRALDLDPRPYLQDLRVRGPALTGRLDPPRALGRRTRFLIIGLAWIVLGSLLVVARSLGWIGSAGDPTPPTTRAAVSSSSPASVPPAVAFDVEVRATRGGSPVRATVDGAVTYDEILRLDEEIRFEGDSILLHVVQPTMVRVFVNGDPVAAETDMEFGTTAAEPAEGTTGETPSDVSHP